MKRGRLRGAATRLNGHGEGIVVVEAAEQEEWIVPGAMPGDVVRFSPEARGRGRLDAVVTPGDATVSLACAHAVECGGCPLMGFADQAERDWKSRRVRDATGLEPVWHPSDRRLAFRTRARLAFEGAPENAVPKTPRRRQKVRARGPRLGFRSRGSHRIVAIERCVVLVDALDACIRLIRAKLLPHLRGSGEISLAIGAGALPVFRLTSSSPQSPELYRVVEQLRADGQLAGAALRVGGATVDAEMGDPRPRMTSFDGTESIFPAGGFAQAQPEMNRVLQQRVVELVGAGQPGPRDVLELYAGAGNLTAGLAQAGHRVTALERNEELVRAGQENLARRGLSGVWLAGDVEALLPSLEQGTFDTVVLDPPREGAAAALAALSLKGVRQLVYVSCNPRSLATDLSELRRAGFQVAQTHALDMFPHTAHVESVVRVTFSPAE